VEQSRGSEQIGNAISQIERVTHRSAAGAEQGAAAAERLNAQAELLNDVVERLARMVGGSDATHRTGRSKGVAAGTYTLRSAAR
jgi:hypothetical protein